MELVVFQQSELNNPMKTLSKCDILAAADQHALYMWYTISIHVITLGCIVGHWVTGLFYLGEPRKSIVVLVYIMLESIYILELGLL